MNKIRFIICLIYLTILTDIILAKNISITLDRTVSLEKIDNVNYESMHKTFELGLNNICDYSVINGDILLICKKIDQKSVNNKIKLQVTKSSVDIDMISSVEVFDSNGDYKGPVGIVNSYINGGIISPVCIETTDNGLFIVDDETGRVNKFRIDQYPLAFEYSISYRDKFDGYNISVINDRLYTSNPKGFLSDNFNSGIVFEFVDDPDYDHSMNIKELDQFIPVNEFRSFFGFGDNDIDGIGDLTPSMIEILKTRGLYTKVRYAHDLDGNVYAVNAFGSEINKLNRNNKIIIKNKIPIFEEIRNEEKNIQERTSSHWNDLYSECSDIFYDNDLNSVILYYRFSKDLSKIKGYSRALLFLSSDTLEPISDLIPIEFIPVRINPATNEMIGLNFIEELPVIEFYEISK